MSIDTWEKTVPWWPDGINFMGNNETLNFLLPTKKHVRPVILFRNTLETEEEFQIASRYFDVYRTRNQIPENSLVIGRYSVLPFYGELVLDLDYKSNKLINTHLQHSWVANFDYYNLLKKYTFETWFDLRDIPDNGSFIVKGRTNSRKARWNTHMFANNRKEAILIATELMQDPLLQQQGIIVRRYEPLEFLEEGLNGQPFVNEHRIFALDGSIVASGFYWSQSEKQGSMDERGISLAQEIAKLIKGRIRFAVIDIAKTQKGEWKLVELNDGQMSGLSCIDPELLYSNLANKLYD